MMRDVPAIKTNDRARVFVWGGDWSGVKDCMHFEIDLAPQGLAVGILMDDGAGRRQRATGFARPFGAADRRRELFRVIARTGLHLREGPGVNFGVVRTLPFGSIVQVSRRDGDWVVADLEGDGRIDGHLSVHFWRSRSLAANPHEAGSSGLSSRRIRPTRRPWMSTWSGPKMRVS